MRELGIPSKFTHTAQELAKVPIPGPDVYAEFWERVALEVIPIPLAVRGFEDEQMSPKQLRVAQAEHGDFSEASYIGIPIEAFTKAVFLNPYRTAVDDIWEGVQNQNRRRLLLAAKVYQISNLAQNEGFLEILQELQDRARKGD